MACPVGFEDYLRHLAIIGPAGGDAFGAFWRAAVPQHHVGMLGERLVEAIPDRAMITELEPAGESDLGAGGEQRLDLRAALGGEEVAAIDPRGGQRAVVDLGAGARAPG